MEPNEAGLYPEMLVGKYVDCVSHEDAVAVRTANELLCGGDPSSFTPADVNRLAAILERYGRRAAAEVLRHISDPSSPGGR